MIMDKCDSEAAHRCSDSHKPDGLANANKNLKVPRTPPQVRGIYFHKGV